MTNHIFTEYPGKSNMLLPERGFNLLAEQKKSWPQLAGACQALAYLRHQSVDCGNYEVELQFNPGRAVSSGAAIDHESISNRPCFLCRRNLPPGQQGILYRNDYLILCNPAPIFDRHFTVTTLEHTPQEIASSLTSLLQLAYDASPDYRVFYNGPACGASAPDHLHFQMIPSDTLPFLKVLEELLSIQKTSSVRFAAGNNFDRAVVVMASENADALKQQFLHLLKIVRKILSTRDEPLVNVICTYEINCWHLTIFLRRKHRPDAYFAEGKDRIFVSPGAIDMAGVVITPMLKDFERLDCNAIQNIYREVSLDEETLNTILETQEIPSVMV